MNEVEVKNFLLSTIKLLVDKPDEAAVSLSNPVDEVWEVILMAHPDNVGQIVGRQGQTIDAIRLLLKNMVGRDRQRCYVKAIPRTSVAG